MTIAVDLEVNNLLKIITSLEPKNIVYPCSGVHPSVVGRSQFQSSSPLEPLGQSKPNFMWNILRKGVGVKVYISGPGHITKMVAMAINGKHR